MDNKKSIPTPLPIGESAFDSVIENGYYYVDKTLFIEDILSKKAKVILCTRPRRFGKTLNQTMLKCFFEDTAQVGGKDTRALFNGLKIEAAGDEYLGHQGRYPVIFLSFKEVRCENFEDTYSLLKDELVGEFDRHGYVAEKISKKEDLELFKRLTSGAGSVTEYSTSLKFLCKCLHNYHGQKVVILIDEYDVPLENSWSCGFYPKIIGIIRPLLSGALKDNPSLLLSVMTGCLRISKESIFTGLNNLEVISILNNNYSEYFGFTQSEMDAILEHYGFTDKRQIIRDWYNGYLFGDTEVYNPWSSILAVSDCCSNINSFPRPYWANTSSNTIVRTLIDKADADAKTDLETLMSGGTISKLVHEDITYDEIDNSAENLWNVLFFTGYLKKVGETAETGVDGELTLKLSIPNIETRYIYRRKISEWFEKRLSKKDLDALFNAVLTGDVETFQRELSAILAESISYMDYAENFYHGFMAGLLSRQRDYSVKSNRESGDGRSDIVIYGGDKAVIIELKIAKKFQELPAASEKALKQIDDKNYAAYWADEGYFEIVKYGIAFYKKKCRVVSGK